MATTEEARATRDAKLDALHEQLTGAVESLVSGEDWKQALEFAARFRARSFNNTLLIFAQHQSAFEAGRVPGPIRKAQSCTATKACAPGVAGPPMDATASMLTTPSTIVAASSVREPTNPRISAG